MPSLIMRWREGIAGVVCVLLLSGCSSGAKLSTTAVEQLGSAMGKSSVNGLELTATKMTVLAKSADVDESVIGRVAPRLENTSVWKQSVGVAERGSKWVPAELRSNLFGLACEVWRGEIVDDDDLEYSIYTRLGELTQDDTLAFMRSIKGMVEELNTGLRSRDPDARASAILTCYTIEEIVGIG